MTKTKIKRAIALVTLVGIMGFSSNVQAAQIGTGIVTGTDTFNSVINWNGTYTAGSASGSVSNIIVKASVTPTLNMTISTGSIDLGTLVAGVTSTGTLNIEIGTNAKTGVSITARSESGGLTKTDENNVQINNLTTDGIAESYTFGSVPNGTKDSNYSSFSATGFPTTEITSSIAENQIYLTNKPEASNGVDDVAFSVAARSVAETPAGAYQDSITFTVTGNF